MQKLFTAGRQGAKVNSMDGGTLIRVHYSQFQHNTPELRTSHAMQHRYTNHSTCEVDKRKKHVKQAHHLLEGCLLSNVKKKRRQWPPHLVPWMMNIGHATPLTLSMFGNMSPGIVKRKLKATRKAEARGLCSMTPPNSTPAAASSSASWHVGPLPSDLPYLASIARRGGTLDAEKLAACAAVMRSSGKKGLVVADKK